MKKSKSNDDMFTPVSKLGKIAIGLFLASPLLILGGIELLGAFYRAHPDPQNRPSFKSYDYVPKEPDIVYKEPKFTSGRDQAISDNKSGGGVVLKLNGVTIDTGADADEIIQQLTIDYQDLFDQYGGSEELY